MALAAGVALSCSAAPEERLGEQGSATWGGPGIDCTITGTPGNVSRGVGAVMTGTIDVYLVWYGWPVSTTNRLSGAQQTIANLAQSIGGSQYFGMTAPYTGSNGAISGDVVLAGQAFDAGSRGKSLQENDTAAIVTSAITHGALPADPNGVYFVVSGPGVTDFHFASGGAFCDKYCGYHEHLTVSGVAIQYGFIGDPLTCPSTSRCLDPCAGPTTPNGFPDGDSMASVLAHELVESATDPDGSGWMDSSQREIGDKCAFVYGPTYTTSTGALANVSLGGHDYLLQEEWVNDGPGYCAMQRPAPPSCYVSPSCSTGSVDIACQPAGGDLVFRRDGVTFSTAYAYTAAIRGASASDTPTGSGTAAYDVCLSTPSGLYCTAPTAVAVPVAACPVVVCKKGWVDCGGYCAPPRSCM